MNNSFNDPAPAADVAKSQEANPKTKMGAPWDILQRAAKRLACLLDFSEVAAGTAEAATTLGFDRGMSYKVFIGGMQDRKS
jgi:hypothetical protein